MIYWNYDNCFTGFFSISLLMVYFGYLIVYEHYSNHGFDPTYAARNNICMSFMYFVQVCKHFLDAVERKQYGWFWACPNGGKNCHYRHALPPGYVLKSQMKALLEEESDKITIEEEIENQVNCFFPLLEVTLFYYCIMFSNRIRNMVQRAQVKTITPITPELFFQWKKKKMDERDASLAAQQAERAKNDRMRYATMSIICS